MLSVLHTGLSDDVVSLLVMSTGCLAFRREFYSDISRIKDELLVINTFTEVAMIRYKAYLKSRLFLCDAGLTVIRLEAL